MSEFFATNPLDPLHWTLNSCFGAFRTIWVHLRPFGCLTKLGAKRFELVQKFVARRRVGAFCYERTRSSELDPKHMFWRFLTICVHLGLLGCLTKLGAKRVELVQKFVPRSRIGIFRDEHTRSTPYNPKLMFWCVSYHLGAFGTVRMPYETRGKTGRTCKSSCHEVVSEYFATNPLDPLHWSLNSCFGVFRIVWVFLRPFRAKHSELVHKFVPRTRVGIFRNESTQSTQWDPKLMFWCVSYNFGAFWTVWLSYETRCKTGRTGAKLRATKSRRNFSQRTNPIDPIGP